MTTLKKSDYVNLDGEYWPADLVAHYMDDEIRENLHSQEWDSEQDFVDAYVIAHAKKYDGEEFIIN